MLVRPRIQHREPDAAVFSSFFFVCVPKAVAELAQFLEVGRLSRKLTHVNSLSQLKKKKVGYHFYKLQKLMKKKKKTLSCASLRILQLQ